MLRTTPPLPLALCALCLGLLGCGDDDAAVDAGSDAVAAEDAPALDAGPSEGSLRVLSSRPDSITGDEALLAFTGADAPTLSLDGDAIPAEWHPHEGRWLARVTDLPLGAHTLSAGGARLPIEVHPRQGPVFSGPHQTPYVCTTESFLLGPPRDPALCDAERIEAFFYVNAADEAMPVTDPSDLPPDVRMVARPSGEGEMPFVIRVEAGVINRAIYHLSHLYDPAAGAGEPWAPTGAWNRKLFYIFGGGCGPGYSQADPNYAIAPNVGLLSLGYAQLHSSLNTLGQNCNDVLSAETAMMVKERAIEALGEPLYTVGFGGSGGSIQQHLIVENYPGILDGIQPGISYPDIWSILPDVVDCRLLRAYFAEASGLWPDADARLAVMGYASEVTCESWDTFFGNLLDPTEGCRPEVPSFDPDTRPDGARCSIHDHNRNLLGLDPATGGAHRPYDNTGVQYGLGALLEGAITGEQFLDLNERIGGFDALGRVGDARSRATDEAIARAYAGGRVTTGGLGLAEVPIVDTRFYADAAGDIHDAFRTFSMRDRLLRANGDADNHVTFFAAPGAPNDTATVHGLLVLDEWLMAMQGDDDPDRAAVVRRHRPAGLTDRCYATTTPEEGVCPGAFPLNESPRLVAGAPRANDVLQCARVPVDRAAYEGRLDDAQLDRLEALFPEGVCDWDAAPPNRAPHAGVWQRYAAD